MTSQYSVPCRSVQTNQPNISLAHIHDQSEYRYQAESNSSDLGTNINFHFANWFIRITYTAQALHQDTCVCLLHQVELQKISERTWEKKFFSGRGTESGVGIKAEWTVLVCGSASHALTLSPSSLAVGSVRLFAKMHLYFLPEDHHSQVGVGGLVHGFGLDAHSVLLRGQLVRAMFLMPEVEKTGNWSPHHDEIAM